MKKYGLKFPKGFDPKTQKQIGYFIAQLDDQLRYVKRDTKELTVKQLEWQPRTGMNTVGVLLAHVALTEVWWINIASRELPDDPDGIKIATRVSGFIHDGIPMKPKDKHPDYFKGYTTDKYLKILDASRRSIKRELKTWKDRDLDKTFTVGKRQFSRIWTLYHLVEHIASHMGQILLLKHMMRDKGVLK